MFSKSMSSHSSPFISERYINRQTLVKEVSKASKKFVEGLNEVAEEPFVSCLATHKQLWV
jgi:hypothetical protein